MAASLLSTLAILGIAGTIAALVTGIVMAYRRRWIAAIAAAVALVFCSVVFLGSEVVLEVTAWFAAAEARGREIEARHQDRIAAVKALTPGVDWTKVNEQFWTNPGLRDFWRTPIRWPYDVVSIDSLEEGAVRRNLGDGRPDNSTSLQTLFRLREYAYDERSVVYRQVEHGNERWGWMEFDTEVLKSFATEADLWRWADEHGWKGPKKLTTVEENYGSYWRP